MLKNQIKLVKLGPFSEPSKCVGGGYEKYLSQIIYIFIVFQGQFTFEIFNPPRG